MSNNPISDFKDEMGEFGKDVGKGVVREVKDMGKIAKAQVTGNYGASDNNGGNTSPTVEKSDPAKDNKKVDPITGKKPPTKQQLNDLKNKTAQLQALKLKKVREELEKQRLKVTNQNQNQQVAGVGPEIKEENKKPKDDAVAKTLKGSKSTGEFKGLVGG